jgi:guanylate kinase
MREGLLLVLSGPSGVGKGTVNRHLMTLKPLLKLSVSMTTRPPRPGEVEGQDYYFAGRSQFNRLIREDAFLEWAKVHGYLYGTRRETVVETLARGVDLLLEIDVQGAHQVRRRMPAAVLIFLAPPSMEALRERIFNRGTEDAARIRRRLRVARQEMEAYHTYDYLVVNDRVEKAAAAISAIIDAEKCRVDRGAKPPAGGGE